MAIELAPYLTMDGNAREAITFYQQALGAEILFLKTFGEMPDNPDFPLPVEMKDKISHAALNVDGAEMMFSDAFPGNPPKLGGMLSVCLTTDEESKAKRIFDALAEEGKVELPFQKTFFSPGYGMVTDKFGIMFQIFTKGASEYK
ncbi:VOC family protein [Paenibacillus brevis]|uniref:VOC family protein n=1 Tax=Paenibacillus brevis TaxID=2841508 RepID=A0ABS6FT44_9BACL|nr:VOC family protein [Paenibacillus brevis]MBU5673401.1 VOC family protein [Paenibacillus brevis]